MHAHIQQQRDPARTENTKSIFIKGLNIKASSGGCQSQMATTQLFSENESNADTEASKSKKVKK